MVFDSTKNIFLKFSLQRCARRRFSCCDGQAEFRVFSIFNVPKQNCRKSQFLWRSSVSCAWYQVSAVMYMKSAVFLGYYAVWTGDTVPTTGDMSSVRTVPVVGCPETSLGYYHSTLRTIPEERICLVSALFVVRTRVWAEKVYVAEQMEISMAQGCSYEVALANNNTQPLLTKHCA